MVPAPETGKIVLIANPVAKSGRGAAAADEATRLLWDRVGEERVEVLYTARPLHAVELAAGLGSDVGCVIALGGDGLVNEVANGLMKRPRDERPALAVIPVGSGNDYAATLGMAYQVGPAVSQILHFRTAHADVGCVNGRYYVETLSFGLDAAIALDTMERRKRTGRSGTVLYLESAVDQLFNHLNTYEFTLSLEGEEAAASATSAEDATSAASATSAGEPTTPTPAGEPTSMAEPATSVAEKEGDSRVVSAEAYLVAVQVGPTYGGHFRITPDAHIDDGLLDVCWATPKLAPLRALAVLLRARAGKHVGNPHVHFAQASCLLLDFAQEPPAQIDGEKITGTHFEISCVPDALTVVLGS